MYSSPSPPGARALAAIMRRNPVIVDRATTLDEAFELLQGYRIRHLPVVECNRLRGLLSDRDLLFWRGLAASEQGLRAARGEDPRAAPRVGELIGKPLHCLGPDASVRQAAQDMVRLGIGAIPVVAAEDDGAELLGLVTESDLLRAYLELCRQAPACDAPARSRMHTPVPHVEPETSMEEALARLDRSLLHLAVLRAGELVGIVSERDLLVGLARDAFLAARARAGTPAAPARVADVMTSRLIQGEPDTALARCAARMLDHKISALPLVERGVLLGLVTQRDVLARLAEVLEAEDARPARS